MTQRNSSPDIHLNLNVRGMAQSATVAINEHSNYLISQGRQVFKLGLGQSPFPVPEPVVEALRDNAHQKDYLTVSGLASLRQAVADYHQRRDGNQGTADDVLIGPGSKELMFLLQLVYYGDLIMPSPAWVSYMPQAKIIGRQVRTLHTRSADGWQLTAEQLDDFCAEDSGRPRLVILNYPSNPTGQTYSSVELQAIAEVARRHRLIILSDEIYGETQYDGRHESISRWYPEGTIISSGLSKWCGAGGWRLGTFTFPQELRWLLTAIASVASETYTSTSAPIQYAAVRAFQGGPELDAYLAQSRKVLAALGRWVCATLNDAGVSSFEPQGGFYLFTDFGQSRENLAARGISTNHQLCQRMLDETGVAILPGSAFGRPDFELTARLAFVDFDGGGALAAAEKLLSEQIPDTDFLEQHCGQVVEATHRICRWVNQ